ncbi:MAG: aminopeptidase P N-terminal domain-containing protein [Bacteroidetes bacterium]|nr:aminopeptidase P N-terminal domain-containing protein [Bacteroidota bacterium]
MFFILNKTPKFFGVFLFLTFFPHFGRLLPSPLGEGLGGRSGEAKAQSLYDNDLLSKDFHAGRRDALRKLMADSSVAVLFSSSEITRSNDIEYEFHQNPNFYYLTGLNEPEAVLLVFKNDIQVDNVSGNEIVFLQDKDNKSERWTGKLLGTEGAKSILGIQTIFSAASFSDYKINFSSFKKVYLIEQKNENASALSKQFLLKLSISKAETDIYELKEMMEKLREVKLKEELDLMRKAINITCDGIKEAMKALEPGMYEYDVEAIVEYVFKSKGAEDAGYPSIVGGGENACILHYETNRKKLVAKDMLVCDVGAEYHGYSADITRTYPVSGKFSEEQKVIYSIVLDAQTAGIAKCKPGEDFRAPHKAAMEVIQKRLMELGIIKVPNEVMNYFFHGTSHYLGLDVHDAGTHGRLLPNSVITVEPGIYIPSRSDCDEKWWGIGIRIEDDVLITEMDPEVLSACVPKTMEEIEALMKKESLFNLMKK